MSKTQSKTLLFTEKFPKIFLKKLLEGLKHILDKFENAGELAQVQKVALQMQGADCCPL